MRQRSRLSFNLSFSNRSIRSDLEMAKAAPTLPIIAATAPNASLGLGISHTQPFMLSVVIPNQLRYSSGSNLEQSG